ncbi:putative histone acetyltransferase chromatin regulator PHD family [Helianthus annuus]|uniref:Histone acetyltransferase chromatin regulator PHD family n=1 Tax=Helianthus annuus TaxID=4232 RepID=A0A251TFQ4_HELAN|nr:uncharacterized protein LOC110884104 [Helianthus annuus]XP_021987465.1 uncharacterized protein LOC110884104 [Helianthus annuus]XP_021987467.1 uncharacterized protein LOC110884104 [Helianthus annuus]KAF5785051.1 putative histone acetyltransferase chromatin regulator PHD family [Helianthus annuus]KAJ0512654.1 putative histone acetyltransferase chromatin regulator PHD family [Helianthus annuus]KAJ0528783.1 putative histone acetyltransferase chromatin regulator PHD family [Helianthus annuus]KA
MKLRSNRVFKREKPKINLCIKNIKNQSFSERQLSLRSSKSICRKRGANGGEIEPCVDDCDENLELGTKEAVNSDDKGLFLGSEVLDPVEDLVVSCPKEETEEGEGNESVSTGVGFKEEIKSPHVVDCENGSKSLESETFVDDITIVNGDDDTGNVDRLGECKEMKKGKRGRKKKNVRKLKNIESNREKIDVVTGVNGYDDADDECTLMTLKRKGGKKRENVEALGAFVTADGGFRAVVLGLKHSDDIPNPMLKRLGMPPSKVLTEGENTRPKKKLKKSGKRCKLQGMTSGNAAAVLSLEQSDDISNKTLKRRGRPRKVLTDGENMRPKKKLKRREITSLPLNEIPGKKVERRGRPRKVPLEIPAGPMNSRGIERKLYGEGTTFKKFKGRGRPSKMEARTLATNVIKMRTVKLMSVKKRPTICKKEKSEENSEQILNAGKGIIGGKRREMQQLVRDKISEILLKCGWTIDRRQRQEKAYKDAVYIEPNGKRSYWSITGAYARLKTKIENGRADDNEVSAFTPIPEEEISILFRYPRKERKKYEKKKNKVLKNVKKGKIVTDKKKKHGKKKSKDGSKRKIIFKPRGFENGSKQDNEGVLVIKKRNLLSWMIDSGVISAGTKVQYGKTRRQKRSSEGVITGDGICCGCCNETMGITKFVGHCGGRFGSVFDNLYLESGACLRNCLVDSWRKEEESDINRLNVVDIRGDDPNDDTCNICGDGGNLICCDGCPSTFHQSCLDVENFPSGDWNCIYCTCKFCGVVSVSTPQTEDSHDEVTSQMLSCYLCEEKFHQLCVQEGEDVNKDLNGLPFCGRKCQELFERLQTYLGVKHELEDGFSWTLLQRSGIDQDLNVLDTQLRVEHNSKLAVAFSVMDECFIPIVDERSGTNIIRNVVYNCGSNFRRLNYAGFLTAVLEKDDEFITAASIRIHGYRLAEMPFIGTRHIYRRQGMCRRLLDAIESTLSSLGVEELIIPAIPALLQTWTDVFGFMSLDDTKKQAMKCMSMMVFPGIEMLKKPLCENQSDDVNHAPSAGVGKAVIDHEEKEETILLTDGCSRPKPNDENNPQVETTSSNATDCKQTSVDTTGVGKDIIHCQQAGKETVLMDCSSPEPDLENDKLAISHGVNGLCDLNLPVKDVLPCDIDGQTSVDSESFPDCAIDPSSFESVICENRGSSELKLDVEEDGVPVVNVEPSLLTSKLVVKNTFDLNLQPAAVETDVHIVSDDSVHCESQASVKSFEIVDQSAGGQTDSKTSESQPLVIR